MTRFFTLLSVSSVLVVAILAGPGEATSEEQGITGAVNCDFYPTGRDCKYYNGNTPACLDQFAIAVSGPGLKDHYHVGIHQVCTGPNCQPFYVDTLSNNCTPTY